MVRNIFGFAPARALRARRHEGLRTSGTALRPHPGSTLPRTARRTQGRIRQAGALVGACLVLALATLCSTPAAAQSETTLISNIGQGNLSSASFSNDRAQQFTTGSNSAGYTVSSIDIVSTDAEGDTFDVQLCTVDSQGYISSASTCTALTRPGSFAAGTLTFTASPAIDLDSNTTYTIRLTNMNNVRLGRTSIDAEDAGGAAGWRLSDAYDILAGATWATSSSGRSLRVAVKGTVKSGGTITIEALQPTVTARADWINFELTRTGDTADALDVTVTLTPPAVNDWAIPMANLSQDVTFAAGADTAALSVGAFANRFGELGIASTARMNGTLTASLEAVNGYNTDDTAEVEVLALDGLLWIASLDKSSLVFTEEGGSQNVVIELRAQHAGMDPPVANADTGTDALVAMALIGGSGSAISGTDFSAVSESLDAHDGFVYRRGADGHMVGRLNVPVSITSDTDDEGAETFGLRLVVSFSSGADVLEVRGPDGTLSNNQVIYTATIRDTPDGHIEDQLAVVGTNFSYAVPSGAFAHLGSSLTYSARKLSVNDGSDTAFPSWLSFTASSATFSGMPGTGDVGRTKVTITARSTGGASGSEVFEIVVSAKPSISGVGRVGETLTAVTGATGTFTYQWVRVDNADTDIAGKTEKTYTLVADDLGNKIKVKVTYGSGMNATTITSDAWPPYANVQPASAGTVSVGARREVWSGTLTVGARVIGSFTEAIGHGWSRDVGRLTQIDSRIELGANAYKIGEFVMLYAQDGDLADLMVMRPGSLVFSLVGAGEDRRSTGPTRQLTAEEKAALRLHVGDKTLHFADANELDWGHYEWQTPDLVWTAGDSIPLALSMPVAFMQPCGALPNEIWCTTMTVASSGNLTGFSDSQFGSLLSDTFSHGGTSYEVNVVQYDRSGRQFRFDVSPGSGIPVFDMAGFGVHAGTLSVEFPAGQTNETIGFSLWDQIPDPGWSNGDRVVVRLTGPGSSQQASEAPTVEGLPAIGGVGTNSVWDAGETLSITLTFSEAVEVDETGGTPTVSFDLGGTKPRSASYESGSGTTALVFEYEVVSGDGSNSLVSMTGNNVALNGGTIRSVANGTDADLAHQGVLALGASAAPRSNDPPSVTLENVPASHDGSSPFTVELSFSGAPQGLRAKSDAASVIDVTGGTVSGARDVSESGQARWEVTIDPDGTGEVEIRIPARACTETGAVCIGGRALEEDVDATVPGPGMTAEFTQAPSAHDGSNTFTLRLAFSHAPRGLSFRTVEGGLFDVTGGRISKVSRTTQGQNTGWELTVSPSGTGDVTLSARATADCAAAHAVCDASGRKFDGSLMATIPGPDSAAQDEPPAPITASWSSVPAEHGGAAETFDVHLDFDRSPGKFSYSWLSSSVVTVEGGAIARAWRRTKGQNDRWGIEVEPAGWGPVTLTVNGTTDCAASEAVCAADGGMLEGGARASVAGPVTVSVADTEVQEGPEAALAFTVTLSRAAGETVTVAYATADDTATAGSDYTATSGTLGFAADETEKTVSVAVLDDVLDEGDETMTLRLSSPSPERVKLADAEATGTIKNADPLQKMWLSRFGRTVADHVTGAVSDRLANPLSGARVTVGGQTVDLAESDDAALLGRTLTSLAYLFGAPSGPAPAEDPDGSGTDGSPGAGSGSLSGAGFGPLEPAAPAGSAARLPAGHEVLLGSSFHLATEGERGGPGLAAWGRVTAGSFDGEAPADGGSVRIDGSVTTGILGADAEWNRVLAGVAVSVSEGEGSFDQPGVDSGTIESTMTTVSPYARLNLNDRLSVWGLAGWGTGDMTIVQAANDRGQPERVARTDLEMRLAALGGRGTLMQADEAYGFDLALRGDAFLVETESEAISNEGSTTGAASRVRLALEGSRAFRMDGGGTLTPGLELGLRHDGGDAETGTGVELGGRVTYTDPETGLGVEARVRTLVAHEDSEYREWGASGSVRLDPGARGRGLSFSLAPTYGAASSGVGRLWSAGDARGLAPGAEFEAEQRLEGKLGYGLGMFGDRFTGTPNLGFGLSDEARDYRLGWRLTPAVQGDTGFEVSLDATRRESANEDVPPEHGVMLRSTMRW